MTHAPIGYNGVPTHAELNIGVDFFAPGPNAVIVKHSRAYSFGALAKTPDSVLQDYLGYL